MPWHLDSLSTSDESQFVPHSAVAGASSVMGTHFIPPKQAEKRDGTRANGQEEHDMNEMDAVGNVSQGQIKELAVVGATICSTPETSPCASPNMRGDVSSLNSNNGIVDDDSEASSLISCASSLTYELLGGNSVQDSTLEGKGGKECIGAEEHGNVSSSVKKKTAKGVGHQSNTGNDDSEMLEDLSPNSTLPSVSSDSEGRSFLTLTVKTLNAKSQPDETKTFQPLNNDLPRALNSERLLPACESDSEDSTMGKHEPVYADNCTNTLPRVLQGIATFTYMSKSVSKRILYKYFMKDADTAAVPRGDIIARIHKEETINSSTKGFIEPKIPADPEATCAKLSFVFGNSVHPSGAGIVVYFFAIVSFFLRMVMTMFLRTRNVAKGMDIQDTFGTNKTPSVEVSEHPGSGLSNLFLDEASTGERNIRLMEEPAWQMEMDERKGKNNDEIIDALDQQGPMALKGINKKVDASKKALTGSKFVRFRYAITSCTLISIVLICIYTLNQIVTQEDLANARTPKEDDLICLSNNMFNFVSIPLWELNLSPAAFESFEEEPFSEQSSNKIWPSSLLAAFVTLFITIPFLYAFFLKWRSYSALYERLGALEEENNELKLELSQAALKRKYGDIRLEDEDAHIFKEQPSNQLTEETLRKIVQDKYPLEGEGYRPEDENHCHQENVEPDKFKAVSISIEKFEVEDANELRESKCNIEESHCAGKGSCHKKRNEVSAEDLLPNYKDPPEERSSVKSQQFLSNSERQSKTFSVGTQVGVIEHDPDGHCLYNSLTFGWNRLHPNSTPLDPIAVRQELALLVRKNCNMLYGGQPLGVWTKMEFPQFSKGATGVDIESYINMMLRGAWGGTVEMALFARYYGVSMSIYTERRSVEGKCWYHPLHVVADEMNPAQCTIHLLYRDGVHYDSLVDSSDKWDNFLNSFSSHGTVGQMLTSQDMASSSILSPDAGLVWSNAAKRRMADLLDKERENKIVASSDHNSPVLEMHRNRNNDGDVPGLGDFDNPAISKSDKEK